MDLVDGIRSRRSVRKFKEKLVPKEVLEKAFDIAKWAPGAGFMRVWEYYVAIGKDRDRLVEHISKNTIHLHDLIETFDEIHKKGAIDFYSDLGGAPVVAFITIPTTAEEWMRKNQHTAAAMSAQTLALALESEGLASCYIVIAPAVEQRIKEEFNLEATSEILIAIAIGYPAEQPEPMLREPEPVTYIE